MRYSKKQIIGNQCVLNSIIIHKRIIVSPYLADGIRFIINFFRSTGYNGRKQNKINEIFQGGFYKLITKVSFFVVGNSNFVK